MPPVIFLLILAALGYMLAGLPYRKKFFPNTRVNGINVSGKTVSGAEEALIAALRSYSMTLHSRECPDEEISGSAVGLSCRGEEALAALISEQNPLAWGLHLWKKVDHDPIAIAEPETDRLHALTESLLCMREADFRRPENAHLSEYVSGKGYTVIGALQGTALDRIGAEEAIRSALCTLRPELDLEGADVYLSPRILSDDPALKSTLISANRCVSSQISYGGQEQDILLAGERISEWIGVGENGELVLDDEGISGFVSELAERYDSRGKPRVFRSAWGQEVTVEGGDYGWKVDEKAEADWLRENIPKGIVTSRMPVFSKQAAAHGAADYGTTYLEINLTAQRLCYYEGGREIISSELGTRDAAAGGDTPTGVYELRDSPWETSPETALSEPVRRLFFGEGQALYSVVGRSAPEGDSHRTDTGGGGIALPQDTAEELFEHVKKGTPLIIYRLAGTETGRAAAGASGRTSSGGTSARRKNAERAAASPRQRSGARAESAAAGTGAAAGAQTESAAASDSAQQETRGIVQPGTHQDAAEGTKEIGPGIPGSGRREEKGPGVPSSKEPTQEPPGPGTLPPFGVKTGVAPSAEIGPGV